MELGEQVALFAEVAQAGPSLQAQIKATESGQVELRFIDFEDGELLSIREQTLDPLPGPPERLRAMFTAAWAWAQLEPLMRMPSDVWDPQMLPAGATLQDFQAVFAEPALRRRHLGQMEGKRLGLTLCDVQAEALYCALNLRDGLQAKDQLRAIEQCMVWPELRQPLLVALREGLEAGWYQCWYDDAPETEMSVRIRETLARLAGELDDPTLNLE